MVRPKSGMPDHVSACVLSADQAVQLGTLARAARSAAVYDLLEYQALQTFDASGCTFAALEAISASPALAWRGDMPGVNQDALREHCGIHISLLCDARAGTRILQAMRGTDLRHEAALCSRAFCLDDEQSVECCLLLLRDGAGAAVERDGILLMYGWCMVS
ncbi:MAG: hypothetical protein U0836_15520 [Pirellulales bacterium]